MLCVACCMCVLFACQNNDATRSAADSQAISSIEDSLAHMSPKTLLKIRKGLANAQDSITYYEYLARLGKYYYLASVPDSVDIYLDRVIAFARIYRESPRRNSLLAYAYNCKAGNYHGFHKNDAEAVALYHDAFQLLMNSDGQQKAPLVCANLGDAYIYQNKLPQAAYWYRRALFLVDSLNLPKAENITLYMGLGHIYLLLQDYDSSLKYYKQTEEHFSEMALNMRAYFLNNYGNYYYYTKDYHSALKKFLQLKRMLMESGQDGSFSMCLCKVNLADVYLNLNDIAESERYTADVEDFLKDNADDLVAYYCNTIRIGQAVKKGDMTRVGAILDSEKKLKDVDFSMRKIRNSYLRKYYEARGDYQRAYRNLIADNQMIDSLEHKRVNMRSSEIMERFEQDTLQLHHRIAIEHKNAEIQKSRSIIFAIVGLAAIISLFVALYIVRSHRKSEQAKLNIMQLKLRNVRNRISPHFIFNVLNSKIASSRGKDTAELLELSKLIRLNIDMSCQIEVTLQRELDFVQRYVEVERSMMGDIFEFTVNVDKAINKRATMVPAMFIQILVENAIVHGLNGWDGYKKLCINITKCEDDRIRIVVTDNGHGLAETAVVDKENTGLSIIRQTIALANENAKRNMSFQIRNLIGSNGNVKGCECVLMV